MFSRFSKRSHQLERLDTGDYTAAEYAKWLNEMRFINSVFGEMRALRNTLMREVSARNADKVTALDVGAGSGALIGALRKWLRKDKTFLVAAELDIESARAIHNGSNGVDAVQCDALRLPFADDSFDYVFCSLFLHHLTDEKAVEMLGEMSRVAARRIFVIDLYRSPVAYYFYKAAARLLLQPFTREDGALSILRSFKPDELRDLARKAGLSDIRVARSAAYRLVLSGR